MRRIWLLACLALAACDDAVVLEVHTAPNAPADTVQLFIGLGTCGDCPGIQPPGAPEILHGEVYYRDDSYRAAQPRVAKVENGVARFRIEASDVGDTFALAVVVDSNHRSAALIQSLPLNDAGKYRVDLREANTNGASLGPKPATTSGSFVDIWTQRMGSFPCMGFERWSDGRLDGRLFIVPGDDLDCDSRGDMECAPYGFDAVGVPTFEEASCMTTTPVTADSSICWLGGPACNEVSGEKLPCVPTDYCMPESYCDGATTVCASAASPVNIDACLFNAPAPSAKLRCTVGYERSTDGTHADICGGDPTFEFDLFPQAPANSSVQCVPPQDSARNLYERPRTGDPHAFVDKVALTTKDANGKTFSIDFKLFYTYTNCLYKAELSGDKAVGATMPIEKVMYAQFWTTRNSARLRKLLVPVEMIFFEDCSKAPTCTLVNDEATNNCLLR